MLDLSLSSQDSQVTEKLAKILNLQLFFSINGVLDTLMDKQLFILILRTMNLDMQCKKNHLLGLDQITQVLLTPIAVGLMNAPEITEIQMTNQNRNFHPSKGASAD